MHFLGRDKAQPAPHPTRQKKVPLICSHNLFTKVCSCSFHFQGGLLHPALSAKSLITINPPGVHSGDSTPPPSISNNSLLQWNEPLAHPAHFSGVKVTFVSLTPPSYKPAPGSLQQSLKFSFVLEILAGCHAQWIPETPFGYSNSHPFPGAKLRS